MTSKKQTIIIAVIAAAVLGSAYLVFKLGVSERGMPEGLIQANGRIEGDTHIISAKISGRVKNLLAHEGDSVKVGQVLAELDDSQVMARKDQADAAMKAVVSRLEASETSLDVFRREVSIKTDRAVSVVKYAEAVLSKAGASKKQGEKDAARFKRLAEEGTVARQKSEQMNLALKVAESDFAGAESNLVLAEKQLDEAMLGKEGIKARESEIEAVRSQVAQAKAAIAEVESILGDFSVRAPADGIITTRATNPGEVLSAGSPLFGLVDLNRLYLKVYVPEIMIGKLKLGLKAKIYTDSMPDNPFDGTVGYISSRAEFTPKEVQTPDERVKLVYAVKIYLDKNSDNTLSPGLPADAAIRWKDEVPWTRPKW